MKKLSKLIFPSLLVVLFILGSILPVHGAGTCTIEVRENITTVSIYSLFEIDIWITDISGDLMNRLDFTVTWDDTQMDLIGAQSHALPGWTQSMGGTSSSFQFWSSAAGQPSTNIARSWLTLTFRCINEGSSPINLINVDIDGDGTPTDFTVTVVKGAVNQNPSKFVGGIITPTNTLVILSPYLTVIGLISTLSCVYLVKQRKKK